MESARRSRGKLERQLSQLPPSRASQDRVSPAKGSYRPVESGSDQLSPPRAIAAISEQPKPATYNDDQLSPPDAS